MEFENPHNLSVEEMMGLDTTRIWVTGMQVFANPDFTMIVLKEQINVQNEAKTERLDVSKNVGSLVMPTEVARQLKVILNKILPEGTDAV